MSDSSNRVLVKIRGGAPPATSFRAAGTELRPLYQSRDIGPRAFGAAEAPRWYVAELPSGAKSPWDLAHARVAAQLGIDDSSVLYAEPDLEHDVYRWYDDRTERERLAELDSTRRSLGVGAPDCTTQPQASKSGEALGPPGTAWHLDDDHSQLAKARDQVIFTDPRTRIAHIDTGYSPHETLPPHLLPNLGRSFVEGDGNPNSAAEDPNNKKAFLIDNSGHGTGTIGILAGGISSQLIPGALLGGAPEAEVLPLRIADRVVLFRTSALYEAIEYAIANGCDVISLSMGGLASALWSEAVDNAYEAGVCMVAAAGNNVNGLPSRNLVYPALFKRVIAACGAMADNTPYHKLKGLTLEGNYGPAKRMESAIAAYTPNIPWPKFGCKSAVSFGGRGTSAATPQVAAAAALWLEKHKGFWSRQTGWRRVEAVRTALFKSAKAGGKKNHEYFGSGILQAAKALTIQPAVGDLRKTEGDSASCAFLRLVTGLGIDSESPRERMFNLELTHRWMQNADLRAIVADPFQYGSQPLDDKTLRAGMEALIDDEGASVALRLHLKDRFPVATGARLTGSTKKSRVALQPAEVYANKAVEIGNPPYRRLRVYAVDPARSTRLATAATNEVTLKVRWDQPLERTLVQAGRKRPTRAKQPATAPPPEYTYRPRPLGPGPTGEYLRVEDTDAQGGKLHSPVDLNDPRLLARDGFDPSEGNPQFHQQMVYAVAMKTIEHFERALGRPVLWRHRPVDGKPYDDSQFVQQLVLRPHARGEAAAFYSPRAIEIQFGYFKAGADDPGDHVPDSLVYACLSHDIVAHETTHAILDGMHTRFTDATPTNPDMLALHEGFADIVALMQHFTIPEVLEHEIERTRGDLEAESMLGSLASQFGRASGLGRGGPLRDAIGRMVDGKWKRNQPNPADLAATSSPHARGAILVAAVFDAFLAIYAARSADLYRLYTRGTGVLEKGAIDPDLVRRLAAEAVNSATHVLDICIRAIDYLPPVDVTFGDYLRALITADCDLVSDDKYGYRVAFVEAFRRRGIHSHGLATMSVDTLRWQGFELPGGSTSAPRTTKGRRQRKQQDAVREQLGKILVCLKEYANECVYLDVRQELFERTRARREELHGLFVAAFKVAPELASDLLRLDPDPTRSFEIHQLRRAMRVGPGGRPIPQIVLSLTQSGQSQAARLKGKPGAARLPNGTTLVVDLAKPAVKYAIYKTHDSTRRQQLAEEFMGIAASDPLRAAFASERGHGPFALLHSLDE